VRALARGLADRLDRDRFEAIAVASDPSGAPGLWLSFSVTASDRPSNSRAHWEACVLAHAVNDLVASRQLQPPIVGYSTIISGGGKQGQESQRLPRTSIPAAERAAVGPGPAELEQAVQRLDRVRGVRVLRARYYLKRSLAVVEARLSKPRFYLRALTAVVEGGGRLRGGLYLTLRNRGRIVVRIGVGAKSKCVYGWVSPKLLRAY
jgi:hypothetical protein